MEDAERDADAEIARNLWNHHKILPPTSFARNCWDWVLLVMIVFSSVAIPFVLVFDLPSATTNGLSILDYVIDIIFIIDIVLIFNTSYYIDEDLVSSRKLIAKRYVQGWFATDIVAVLPWELASKDLVSLRLLRLLRLSKVIKKVDQLKGGMALRFFYLIFWWLLIAHWTACMWWYIGKTGWNEERKDWEAGIVPSSNETNWLVRIPPNGKLEDSFSNAAYTECWHNCVEHYNKSPVECKALRECDDNNFDPRDTGEVFNHWLSSFYWAFTMLMKTPYVGPDTLPEKIFSCIMVIIGAIIFALLLGQVTTLIISASKAGAALRDTLVQYRLFAATRLPKGYKGYKLYDLMAKQTQAEWQETKGMETHSVLEPFPLQLRGDVLNAVFANLIGYNPPFLRCTEQLRRQVLSLLRPAVALKKSTVVAAHQFSSLMYILIKGTLQVSQAPDALGNQSDRSGGSPSPPARGKSEKVLKRQGTSKFKDKLKVRMLEKPGAIIPLEDIYGGAKKSPFSVFAVTRCQLLTVDASALAGVLRQFPSADSLVITDAFAADYKNLTDSLKMTTRASKTDGDGGDAPSPAKAKRASMQERASVAESVTLIEARAGMLTAQVDELAKQTEMLPEVLKVIAARVEAAATAKKEGGGSGGSGGSSSFFGFGASKE